MAESHVWCSFTGGNVKKYMSFCLISDIENMLQQIQIINGAFIVS